MKTWENAAVEEIKISETQFGGRPSMTFDNYFTDGQQALHVNFAS